jgi:hypothetical protein
VAGITADTIDRGGVCGVEMLTAEAVDDPGVVVWARDAARGGAYRCPGFLASPLVVKRGQLVIAHFAHPGGVEDCSSEPETPLHLASKLGPGRRHQYPPQVSGASSIELGVRSSFRRGEAVSIHGVVRIIGPSGRVANTYLVDLGGGWGTVYHDDLRYIEDPRSLAALQLDARWHPWQLVSDPTIAAEVASNAVAAVRLAAPERRELLQER